MSAQPATASEPATARRLSASARRAVLTVHIMASVGLLGDVAAVLAVNVQAASTGDPELAAASYELLALFTVLFGIPLSVISLLSGIVLGAGTKWGILRYAWVTTKLCLLLSVIVVGALVLGPGIDAMRHGDAGAETRLILGAAWDVVALSVATGLSVYKPYRLGLSRAARRDVPRRR